MPGVILGTASYMSPEQARGKPVDKRADIWAFGAVLFEMLTGRRAFPGEDITDTIVSVVSKEPDWGALPTLTPMGLRRLLARCLKKDPKARMRDIGEARLQIEDLISGATEDSAVGPAAFDGAQAGEAGRHAGPNPISVAGWRQTLPVAVATAVLAAAAVLMLWAPWRSAPVPAPRKLLASIGADASLTTTLGASAILSPDGTTLAFVAQQAGQTRLFIRKLDQLQAAPLTCQTGPNPAT
jgi:serine/threonine-protein kinase